MNTTFQIQDDNDPTAAKTEHHIHLVDNYPEKETLRPMIEKYVPLGRRQDDSFERFMEQWTQKLNNSEQPDTEDSLPFRNEPLRAAPTTLPRKRVINTSSECGVNSPHVLSPAMPLTPDISQPHPIPSTSRMNLPSRPLTPIQQFIHNSLNRRTRNLSTIVLNPIIRTNSLFFTHSLARDQTLIFVCILYHFLYAQFGLLPPFLQDIVWSFLFQMKMPKCHKI